MDKNKIKIIAGAAVGVAILVAGGGYYHFHTSTHSPEYALKTVEKTVSEHDKTNFYKVVDVDNLLNDSYDGLFEGLMESDDSITDETRDAVKNFTQMLKAPLILSLKNAIDSYVETGNFQNADNSGANELLERTGIDKIEFRSVDNVTVNPENENEAFADVKIFHPELGQEFIVQVVMKKNNDQWQVVLVQNLQDFISQIHKMRRAKIDEYLTKSSEINFRHDNAVREAEQKYGSILSIGSLGQSNTRSELKTLMLDVLKKDWETRKQELFSLSVPKGAETLHNLRLKICDLEIGYAEDYAKWMEDKKASTIKAAEEKHHQAQTLMVEAAAIARRMTNN